MQDRRTLGAARALARREEPLPTVAQPQLGLKEIPYDHVATFTLVGNRSGKPHRGGHQHQRRRRVRGHVDRLQFHPRAAAPPRDRARHLRAALGVLHLGIADLNVLLDDVFDDPRIAVRCLFARLCGIDFTYSIIDSGTGRELQNRSIHNIAGLGSADGRRPFRPLAKPMLFMPRSTIRIVVDEVSEGELYQGAQLFIVLHGYKILGYGV